MLEIEESKLAGLETLKRKGKPESPVILFLHGYGADHCDLVPLADFLDPQREFTWYFPKAPIELDLGYAKTGYAWFPIDRERLEGSFHHPPTLSFERSVPPGMDEASEKLNTFLNVLHHESPQLILGGFSQGAMMALNTSLMSSLSPKALILFSGILVKEEEWRRLLKTSCDLNIFQSHGRQDQVLPFALAEALIEIYKECGLPFKWLPFHGGHEIPADILKKAYQFIRSVI